MNKACLTFSKTLIYFHPFYNIGRNVDLRMTDLVNACDADTTSVNEPEVSENASTDGTPTPAPEVNKTDTKSESDLSESGKTNGIEDEDKSDDKSMLEGKRNVSFPDGFGIVTGYLEPPDPWKNGTSSLESRFRN